MPAGKAGVSLYCFVFRLPGLFLNNKHFILPELSYRFAARGRVAMHLRFVNTAEACVNSCSQKSFRYGSSGIK